jgi:type IV pilus assembly protein PilV
MLKRQRGSILIEGLIAVAIFSFGLIALMGMQAVSVKNSMHAQYRNEAGQLASQILSQIMVDQSNIASYADGGASVAKAAWLEQVESLLPNGGASITYVDTAANPRTVTVTLTWRALDEDVGSTHQFVTSASIMPAIN